MHHSHTHSHTQFWKLGASGNICSARGENTHGKKKRNILGSRDLIREGIGEGQNLDEAEGMLRT